ncbi:MAG: signal peptide peptidase SppA [Nitrospinota bacterium]
MSFFSPWILGDTRSSGEKIGVVSIEGIITGSEKTIRQLKKYEKDDSVKGIILRIESPGGGVGASQEIYSEVLRIKKKKKIFVSLGGLAASGGYYIACGADKIFANSGTITGSLGVIMAFSNIEGFLKKVGLKTVVVKSGRYKDIGQPSRAMSESEKKILQTVSDDIHVQFKKAVSLGRDLPFADVEKFADGRIFSGRMAKEIGLVDELGGREAAIQSLARSVGIQGVPQVIESKGKKNFLLKLLTSRFSSFFQTENVVFTSGAQFLFQGI